MEAINVKCNRCKSYRTQNDFMKNGREMKTCIKCREDAKKYSDRYRDTHKDELTEKKKKYRESHREQLNEASKKYYLVHKDERKEYNQKYYECNKEQISEDGKLYREKNEEHLKEQKKIYREEHKEEIKETQRKYYVDNMEHLKEKTRLFYENNKKHVFEYYTEYVKKMRENNPLKLKLQKQIWSSKEADRKKNRFFKEEDFIDYDFLVNMYNDQNGLCYYEDCKCEMDILTFDSKIKKNNLITIQRLNNDIAHIKSNVVYSCFQCNCVLKKEKLEN